MLCLQLPNGTFTGQIQNFSSVRDTLDRQEILCRFKSSEIKSVGKPNFRLSNSTLIGQSTAKNAWQMMVDTSDA